MVDLPEIKNVVPQVQAPQSRVSPGQIAQPFLELSANLDKAGEMLSKDVAEPLARRAGLQAVSRDADGNVQVERPPIVGDAAIAWSRAMKVSAVADFEKTFQVDDAKIRNEHRSDPEGYLKATKAYGAEKVAQYKKAAGPEAALSIEQIINNQSGQTYRGLLNEKQRLDLISANRVITASIEQDKSDLFTLYRNGGENSPDAARLLGNIQGKLGELVRNPLMAFPQELADQQVAHLKSELRVASLTRSIVDETYAQKGYNEAVREAEGILRDRNLKLPDNERMLAFSRVKQALDARARDDNRIAAGINDQITRLGKTAAQGYPPNPDELATVRTAVDATQNPALAANLARVEATLPIIQSWRQMSPPQLEAALGQFDKELREKGASDEALVLKDTGYKLLKEMRKEIAADPLGWADRTGVPIPPINFGAPDAPAQMQDRIARAETVAAHYGVKPTYLRPDEQRALTAASAAGGDAMIAAAKLLSDGFGDRAPRVMREIAKDAPVLAHVGALTSQGGSPQFLYDVAEAERTQQAVKAGEIKLPKQFESDAAIKAQQARAQQVYGGAFLLAPDSARAATAAAQKAFFTRALRNGLDPSLGTATSAVGTVDKEAYDKALQESAGARFTSDGTQYGGIAANYRVQSRGFLSSTYNNVLVPSDIRTDRFKDVIGAVTADDLKLMPVSPVAADGKPYTPRDLQNAVPVATRGGYRFALGDPASDDPKYLRGADGKPWVLDLDRLGDTLRKRVPGAYLGGSDRPSAVSIGKGDVATDFLNVSVKTMLGGPLSGLGELARRTTGDFFFPGDRYARTVENRLAKEFSSKPREDWTREDNEKFEQFVKEKRR